MDSMDLMHMRNTDMDLNDGYNSSLISISTLNSGELISPTIQILKNKWSIT